MRRFALALAAAALGLAATSGAEAAATFTDPAGDAETAPDLTAVAIANDAGGTITFTISLADQAGLAADSELALGLDSDHDDSTGDSAGFDTLIEVYGADRSWSVGRWNGATYDFNASAPSLTAAFAGGTVTIVVHRRDLLDTTRFSFYLFSVQLADGETVAQDDMPDGEGVLEYALTLPRPLALAAGKPVARPLRPVAGKALVVSVPVRRVDTGRPLAGGRVSCRVTVGGRAVRAVGRFGSGRPQCVVRVPAGARGKLLRGTLTVVFGGARVTKAFSYVIG
jgi:hypothetical protein